MVFNTNNEQRLDFRVHNNTWEPIDFDGIKLILRPNPKRVQQASIARLNHSKASKMLKIKQLAQAKKKNSILDKYVVIDIETTGVSLTTDKIIEIGAILIEKGKIINQFNHLIKPNIQVPVFIENLTGITNEMVARDGRDLSFVLPEFLRFIGELPIISHNLSLDIDFLRIACQKLQIPLFFNKNIDTLSLARRLLRTVSDYKLSTLSKHFNFQYQSIHRSIADCILTNMLYRKLIEIQQT